MISAPRSGKRVPGNVFVHSQAPGESRKAHVHLLSRLEAGNANQQGPTAAPHRGPRLPREAAHGGRHGESTTTWWQSAEGCGTMASASTWRTSDVENFTWEYEQRRLGATATRELHLCRDFVWSKVAGSGG